VNKFSKTLISPTGDTYIATSAVEVNDLVYGSGYREADEATSDAEQIADATSAEKAAGTDDAYGGEVTP